ncbi:MAG TPA: hypothetical protein VII84_06765, partial [Acidimicrobiales bacterium]
MSTIGLTKKAAIAITCIMMAIAGRWNWWLPASMASLIGVKPSPLGAPEARAHTRDREQASCAK